MATRILIMTILITLLFFVLALFAGIVTILIVSIVRGGGLDMTLAYRSIALPFAIVGFFSGLAFSVRSEIRFYRSRKAETIQEQLRRVA